MEAHYCRMVSLQVCPLPRDLPPAQVDKDKGDNLRLEAAEGMGNLVLPNMVHP